MFCSLPHPVHRSCQQFHSLQPRGLAIEGIERHRPHALRGRKHHQVRKPGASRPIAEGSLGDIVSVLDDKALGRDEFFQDRCDTVPAIAVGPLENPDQLYDNLPAGIGRLLGRNRPAAEPAPLPPAPGRPARGSGPGRSCRPRSLLRPLRHRLVHLLQADRRTVVLEHTEQPVDRAHGQYPHFPVKG